MSRALIATALTLAGWMSAPSAFAADIQSVSRIEFGPADVLFAADWKQGAIHALELPAASSKTAEPFNLLDINAAIERELGTSEISVEDMKVRPGTGKAYLAVSYGASKRPAILEIDARGNIERLDLKRQKATMASLEKLPDNDQAFWGRIPMRSLTVSDMKWHGDKLYVAGISNQTFASSLRVLSFPFDSRQSLTSIAIFHTSHGQVETRAPIRALNVANLGGTDHLVAAYMCTPLVVIPIKDLKDGAHITGKTIAELGYGNTPIDLISYAAPDEKGKQTDYMLLTNVNLSAHAIPMVSIEQASKKPSLAKNVSWSKMEGVDAVLSPVDNSIALDNLDDKRFLTARRDLATGDVQLVSVSKAYKLRISDYVSDYDFPTYSYPPGLQTDYIKPVQDGLMREEGYEAPISRMR